MSIFPVRESCTVTDFGADATAHAANMPATVNPGDLLLAIAAFDSSATTITTPGGWTLISAGMSSDPVYAVYALVAIGNEDGTTVDFATNNAQRGSVHVVRVTSWVGTLDGLRCALSLSNTSAINAKLVTGTKPQDILWIGAQVKSSATAWGATPAGWSNEAKTNATEDATTSASIASATQATTANSLNTGDLWLSVASALNVLIAVLPIGGTHITRPLSQIGV